MKTISAVLLTAAAALIFAACGAPPANNTPPATNTNTAKPVAAAPTVNDLMGLDKQANDAYSKGDSAFFEGFLNDKFTMAGPKGEHMTKADTVKMIGSVKCDVKNMNFEDPQMAKVDNDTYVISYKAMWEGTCNDGPGGKPRKMTGPIRSASVYVRNGDKWQGAWHGETNIVGEKAAAAAAPSSNAKTDQPKAETKKDEPKAEAKKAETKPAKAADPSGAADTTGGKTLAEKAKAMTTTAANTTDAAKAKPTADPNTEALMKIHTAGWEAWKARDAAKLGELTSSNLSFVNPIGKWFGDKASTIKEWTEPKCDIKSVSVADGFATALSPTVEVLYAKGTASGTCEGPDGKPMKLTPLWNAAVYVKEGSDWKLAFLFESPA